jgi:predicted membrane protein (TIGR00267 family)
MDALGGCQITYSGRVPGIASPLASVSTRLGRAVRAGTRGSRARSIEQEHDSQRQGNWLRDVILGGQDGLVNVLGIALGISAATADVKVLITAGLAATFTESISMGAVAYTSTITERDRYEALFKREEGYISEDPAIEREEVRKIYADKGFSGDLLERVVDTITANRDEWVNSIMADDLRLEPVKTSSVLRTSIIVTIACLIGSFLPLLPFIFFPRGIAIIAAIAVSAVALFAVGVYQAVTMVGNWFQGGIKMVVIGLGAAFAGFIVGRLFHTSGS